MQRLLPVTLSDYSGPPSQRLGAPHKLKFRSCKVSQPHGSTPVVHHLHGDRALEADCIMFMHDGANIANLRIARGSACARELAAHLMKMHNANHI